MRGIVLAGLVVVAGCSDGAGEVETQEESCFHGDVTPGTILIPGCRTDSYILVIPEGGRAVFHLVGPELDDADIACVIEIGMPEPLGPIEKAFWTGGPSLEIVVEPGYYDMRIAWLVPEWQLDDYAIQIRHF